MRVGGRREGADSESEGRDRGETHREERGTEGEPRVGAGVPEGTQVRDETRAVTGWELGTLGDQRVEAGGI